MESEYHSGERFLLWLKKFCLICWELLKGKHTRRSRNWFGEPLIFPRPSVYSRTSNPEHAVIKTFTTENLFLLVCTSCCCQSLCAGQLTLRESCYFRQLDLKAASTLWRLLPYIQAISLYTSLHHHLYPSTHLYIQAISLFILIIMACHQIPISHIPTRWDWEYIIDDKGGNLSF